MISKAMIKSNKGSAIVLVIMIIMIMALLGVTLMVATTGGFNMSVFYNDTNKAYFVAEAAVEQIAKVVDATVGEAQENARMNASDFVQDILQTPIPKLSATPGPDNGLYRDLTGEIIQSEVDKAFKAQYQDSLLSNINSSFTDLEQPQGSPEYVGILKALLDTTNFDNGQSYKDIDSNGGRMILESASYQHDDDNHIAKLNIRVVGEYNGYKKKLEVTFNLFPDPEQDAPYKLVQKGMVNKEKERYNFLLKDAIISEKNIVAAGGNVAIKGDVVSFGTIPVDGSTGEENQGAQWNEYGGIMAGICPEVISSTGINSSKLPVTTKNGSLTIDGNAATMAYIHSLYGTDDTNHSDITITGDAYARAVRSGIRSNYSVIDLQKDVYTTDNLQIDSSGSIVNVQGKYYGFVDAGYMIDGTGENDPDKELKDQFEFKRTSSIIVNGDSLLNLNDEVYIGGSSFLKDYTDSENHPFMTGISALKSGKRVVNAFNKDDETNTSNTLFWYENGAYVTPAPAPAFKNYSSFDLFDGQASNPGVFSITNRAMHFKGVWENLWKNNEIYANYIDTNSIGVTGNGIYEGTKLKGYSNGAVVANGKVYGVNDFVYIDGNGNPNPPDSVVFHAVQDQCINNFRNMMQDFLNDGITSKLDYVQPVKGLNAYTMDASNENYAWYIKDTKIKVNEPYTVLDKGIFYYGDHTTDITFSGGKWYIDGHEMTMSKGILYIKGDLYIDHGFSFNGIIMATGNVVFKGDANITYDGTVTDILDHDLNVDAFFKLLTYEVPDGNTDLVKSQRISKNNISIEKWNEVSGN